MGLCCLPRSTPCVPRDVAEAAGQLAAARDDATRERAARSIAAFCDDWADGNKVAARDAGAIGPLVDMLGRPRCSEVGALALWKLSRCDANKRAIAEAGGIPPLIQVLKSGTLVAKENAGAALCNLGRTTDNKVAIAEAGAIPPLVDLVADRVENAAVVLANLADSNAANKITIRRAGAIPPLVDLLTSGTALGKADAAVGPSVSNYIYSESRGGSCSSVTHRGERRLLCVS
mmetsp:Transcript_16438/g.53526  ORF Transcript_16438/g.53526 Transcript_16438/m.53526 type:complete len:232 (+) Transcript_16438:55-750(+)